MTWQEHLPLRRTKSKTWVDPDTGIFHTHAGLAHLHYPSAGPESSITDAEIDLTPQRIQNAQLDGWRVTQNAWHYAIGQPGDKPTDGWVGFGGRNGAHWLRFRLARVGYLHWPTRAWDDLGGAPTYTRANLSQTPQTNTIGPAGAQVTMTVATHVTWTGIWTTPGGGRLDISWRVEGGDLKEEILVNQAAREWIAANRPPITPAAETYFGFVFQLDVSDIPRWLKAGVVQDIESDFEDGGTTSLQVQDALSRVLAFLPVSHAYSAPYVDGNGRRRRDSRSLRTRIWKDGDGNHYLLVGARIPELASMAAGPVVFDPTFDIGETAEDAASLNAVEYLTFATNPNGGQFLGNATTDNFDGGWIYRSTGIPQGSSIISATHFMRSDSVATVGLPLAGAWWGYDVDNPADFVEAHAHRTSDHATRTTATVADNINDAGDHTSPDLSTILQEVVDRVGFSGDLGVTWRNSGSAGSHYKTFRDYAEDAALSAELTVTWSGATWEQEGYRWRADDGDETTATWLAAQDTPITRAPGLNTRLRTLGDTAGPDTAAVAIQEEYRKVGNTEWHKVGE